MQSFPTFFCKVRYNFVFYLSPSLFYFHYILRMEAVEKGKKIEVKSD